MLAARALLILVRRRCVVAVHMPACGLNEFLSRTVAIMMAINTQNEPRTIGGLEAPVECVIIRKFGRPRQWLVSF